jgi:hypothetical protein
MTATAPSEKIDAQALCRMLARRYEPPQWVVAYELTIADRRLDVIALNLWGSHNLIGFEVKASRSDWLAELRNFSKSRPTSEIVDEFYVVAPRGIVAKDELPKGWGLLEARGSKLYLGAHPERRAHHGLMSREAATRIIARVRDAGERASNQQTVADREALRQELLPQVSAQADRIQRDYNELHAQHLKLTQALGVGPYDWRGSERAVAIARILTEANHNPDAVLASLARSITQLDHLLTNLRKARAEYDATLGA